MTIDQRIKGAIEPIVSACVPHTYGGTDKVYCTYNYSVSGRLWGDDSPIIDICLIQLHLFLPPGRDPKAYRWPIRRALLLAGFTWPDMADVSDADYQHYVFEFQLEEGACNDG